MLNSANSSTYSTSGHNECDSDTSGYLSASSLDSTGEERRLAANDDKIMSVWSCWSQNIDSSSGPKCSTPKRTSSSGVLKKRINFNTGSGRFSQKSRSEGDLRELDWKRRPYMTQSTSETDVRIAGNQSKFKRLPRYRVTMNNPTRANHGAVSSLSVNESMTEFLSNVNQENLASYLQFYEQVTRKANIKRFGRGGSVFV